MKLTPAYYFISREKHEPEKTFARHESSYHFHKLPHQSKKKCVIVLMLSQNNKNK